MSREENRESKSVRLFFVDRLPRYQHRMAGGVDHEGARIHLDLSRTYCNCRKYRGCILNQKWQGLT